MTLADILRARTRIAPHVRRTPLVDSPSLAARTGSTIALKLESLQRSHSFKSRGAFNAVIARLERGAAAPRQLVTASAGNHGRALAEAAETFGLPLVVFTPADAPRVKLSAIERHGATLRAEGRDYDDAEVKAKALARDQGAEFISPYNDADVVAGAGTIAIELFEERPGIETIVIPIGGGGLISGMAVAVKAINPSCRVIGVEVEASCAFQTSVRAGQLVTIVPGPTLADGLGGNPDPDTITFALIQQFVDAIVTVNERDLAAAIAHLATAEHVIAEGAGAVGVAALLTPRPELVGREVALVVTGSNIDRERLVEVLRADGANGG